MTKIYQTAIFLLLFAVTFVTGCRHASYSPKLEAIDRLIAENPDSALSKLSRISPDSLSEADRNLYSLLTVKAGDKNYVRHSSDSLILTVIDYYDRHDADPRHAEALYYGGRVYSDIGDYPSALRYFQAALDKLPEDTENLRLRNTVLSQTGRLLNYIRLYKEAAYYLEQIRISPDSRKDSISIANNLQLLGAVYLHSGHLDKADSLFRKSLDISGGLPADVGAKALMYLAGTEFKKGNTGSALGLIRGIPEKIGDDYKYTAQAYAANIYLQAGIPDTSFMYANQLIHGGSRKNVKNGFELLFTDELKGRVPQDSVNDYYKRFAELAFDFVEKNGDRSALIQESAYNYSVHQRERHKAERKQQVLQVWIIVVLLLLLIIAVVLIITRTRAKNRIIRMQTLIDNLNSLDRILDNKNADVEKDQSLITPDEEELRKRLRAVTLRICEKSKEVPAVPESILHSANYARILQSLKEGEILKEDIWTGIENDVLKESPKFKTRLQILSAGRLNKENYRMSLLIKCGFKPAQIAILVGRSKTAITERRKKLCELVFDENKEAKIIDTIIRRL